MYLITCLILGIALTALTQKIKRCNAFSAVIFDKFDPVQISESEDIAEISKILEKCQ